MPEDVMSGARSTPRLAVVADLHFGRAGMESVQPLLHHAAEAADILVICGDLTDLGLPEEAQSLVREFATVKLPIVAVLGNHDYHSGKIESIKQILVQAGVHVLDGNAEEIQGVGFAGVKGFAGGFGPPNVVTVGRRYHQAVRP